MGLWLRRVFRAAAFLLLLAFWAGAANLTGALIVDNPAAAQVEGKPPGSTLGSTSDSDLWRTLRRGFQGKVSFADKQKGVAIQSEGDNWRAVRNGPLSVYGGWLLLATIVILAVFFAVRGRIRVDAGLSGRTIERFNTLERFTHWLTASSFIVLALTGLNVLYGKYVLMPIIGQNAFAALTYWGKLAHNYIAFAFMIGIAMMLVLWVRDNLPSREDVTWVAQGGGMFVKGVHPPASRRPATLRSLITAPLVRPGFRLQPHLGGPQAVVFVRPVLVDLARRHSVEGPLHAKRTDVNMADDDDDHDQRQGGVPQLRQLDFLQGRQLGRQVETQQVEQGEGPGKGLQIEEKHEA